MSENFGLFEAIYTTRAIRRFKNKPVPLSLLHKVLDAANQGPSGVNNQPWRFVILRSTEQKKAVAQLYEDGFFENRGDEARLTENTNPSVHLALHMAEAPVIIVATTYISNRHEVAKLSAFASSYPSIQNLLLAARALGLGGTITTNHVLRHEEIKAQLALPEDRQIIALVPLGFPDQRHGPKTRNPVEEVCFSESWGQKFDFKS